MLAKATGCRVLLPDLYKGALGVDTEEAQHVSRASSAFCESCVLAACLLPCDAARRGHTNHNTQITHTKQKKTPTKTKQQQS